MFDGYRLVAAVQLERLTRRKSDGDGVPDRAIDEVLAIAGLGRADVDAVASTRTAFPWRFYSHFRGYRRIQGMVKGWLGRAPLRPMMTEMRRHGEMRAEAIFNRERFLAEYGFKPDAQIRFFDHHLCHALPALFFTDWLDALCVTADGGGDYLHYSQRLLRGARLVTLFGDDAQAMAPRRIDSLGLVYGYATTALGFRMLRHEGKLTGLAALGEPLYHTELAQHFRVDTEGRIDSDFASYEEMHATVFRLADGARREDVAASVQRLLEDIMLRSVRVLLERHKTRRLALSGGVFANVRLNQLLAEETGIDELFVFPAMGDEGLAAGAALGFLLDRDGLGAWLDRRHLLPDLYLGRDYGERIDTVLSEISRKLDGDPAEVAANLLAAGRIVAVYTGRGEFGPRALGARSILANAADPAVNDTLNARLTRSEFMPFAPVIAAEDAARVFDVGRVNRQACRFMTITCATRAEWRSRIPGVVHVDGTARPQIVERASNPLYFDILARFKALTGLPALVNTSFNMHEEPIIYAPEECRRALAEGRVDFVATARAVYPSPTMAPDAPRAR